MRNRRVCSRVSLLALASCAIACAGESTAPSLDLSPPADVAVSDVGGDRAVHPGRPDSAPVVDQGPPLTWSAQASGTAAKLFAVGGSGKGNVVAAGDSALLRSTGQGDWTAIPDAPAQSWRGLWLSAAGELWIGGLGGALYHAAPGGALAAQTSGVSANLHCIWGFSKTNLYAVGRGVILHSSDGTSWEQQDVALGELDEAHSFWGSAPSDLHAVGWATSGTYRDIVLRSTGDGTWDKQVLDTYHTLSAVWGSSANDLYAVGGGRTILHSTGDGSWTAQSVPEEIPATTGLHSVWGSGPNDIYVSGSDGVVLHSDGSGRWTLTQTGTLGRLWSIWGSGPDDVYAVGDDGVILHRP